MKLVLDCPVIFVYRIPQYILLSYFNAFLENSLADHNQFM